MNREGAEKILERLTRVTRIVKRALKVGRISPEDISEANGAAINLTGDLSKWQGDVAEEVQSIQAAMGQGRIGVDVRSRDLRPEEA